MLLTAFLKLYHDLMENGYSQAMTLNILTSKFNFLQYVIEICSNGKSLSTALEFLNFEKRSIYFIRC